MIDIDSVYQDFIGDCAAYPDPNALIYRQVQAQIAIAEQLKRIADVLEAVTTETHLKGGRRVVNNA